MFPKFKIGDVAYLRGNAESGDLARYEITYIKVEFQKDKVVISYSSVANYASNLLEEKYLLTRKEAVAIAKEYHERKLAELKESENE